MHLSGGLFSRDFLREGIKETDDWTRLPSDELQRFADAARSIFQRFPLRGSPNEAHTEHDLIFPLLELLGWVAYLPQQGASRRGRSDIPDALLFLSPDAKQRANAETREADRYRHGIAVLENKAWQVALDRPTRGLEGEQGVPSSQILRYLSLAEVQSERAIRWGLLTNGRHWRLYWQGARSRSEEFLELDLPLLLGVLPPDLLSLSAEESVHWLRVFYLMFRRSAFAPGETDRRDFHAVALDRGRLWEARIAEDLSEVVDGVYPHLADALAAHDPAAPRSLTASYLDELRDATLLVLYRLLFILYAEDRNLFPAEDERYNDYGLRRRVREDVARRLDGGDPFSAHIGGYWRHFVDLCAVIDSGDASIGVPPYNGGLFSQKGSSLLRRVTIPDAVFAPLLDRLSRRAEDGRARYINYRDLSVQQLGSIYERLLELEPVTEAGGVVLRPNPFARKTSGSYYTPDELVTAIIERSVGPLIDERLGAFRALAEKLSGERRPKKDRLVELKDLDAATRILELKICDPAMGSGHFLVSLVDYLADRVLEAMAEAEVCVSFADEKHPYVSPVTARIETIRLHILAEAREQGWTIAESSLDDRHIIRRMILKRCIYGVDKNPMAVELAKVALWLHTFTVGAPLSFLDHHLRCGDSLYGEWVRPVLEELRDQGLFINQAVGQARQAVAAMARIEAITDADIAEVRESAERFAAVSEATAPLSGFLDFWHAVRWLGRLDRDRKQALQAILDGSFGNPVRIVSGLEEPTAPGEAEPASLFEEPTEQVTLLESRPGNRETWLRVVSLIREARGLAAEQRFLHWEVAFPGVWQNWESVDPEGGFDAVIGNPPWDRIKLQEVEWFAARRLAIARAQRAVERKRMIGELQQRRDALYVEYELARNRAESAARVARQSGQYPLLSRGDTNLNSLFIERADRLIGRTGIAAMLVPSGIATDLSSSEFFRQISSENRLACVIDFFNKRADGSLFFPDVYYRFKFCIFAVSGAGRPSPQALFGFYLRDVREMNDPERVFEISSDLILLVNPNTGTAPLFLTQNDARLGRCLYSRTPVLNKKGEVGESPLKYFRLLDMANDSGLFWDKDRLTQEGAYKVTGNQWKRGEDLFLPLYEGKMVQAFDHRAARIVLAAENVFRPGQSDSISDEEHADPQVVAVPRYYVPERDSEWPLLTEWSIAVKDVTSVTNARTVIAAIVPKCAAGHTLPLIGHETRKIRESADWYREFAPLVCANMNSFVYDYLVRQKIQGNHLAWFILEQTPLIPDDAYRAEFGNRSVADLIRSEVLYLTYTAHDIEAFARDMEHDGPPIIWDEEERRHSRARLDALYFLLHGIGRDDAEYVLSTFPIVRRQDEEAFGAYRTKDLILGYMAAFEAGDVEARISA